MKWISAFAVLTALLPRLVVAQDEVNGIAASDPLGMARSHVEASAHHSRQVCWLSQRLDDTCGTPAGCCDGLAINCCDCSTCQEIAASRAARIHSQLTGDWCGRRTVLEGCGIDVRSSLTQFYQGVSRGGTNRRFRYGAKYDLYFDLDSKKMGLWEGGELLIHLADWQFGQNANADATFGSPVNFNLLFPEPEESFAVSHFLYRQALTETGWLMEVGRYSLLDLWDGFYPGYGDGLDGFMNASLICPFNVSLSGIPPISNMAGLVKVGEKGLEGGVIMFENDDNSNKIGLQFPNGVTFLLFARKYTEFGGLLGSHTLASTLSTSDFTDLNYNDWIEVPGGLPLPTARSGQWTAGYIGEQRIYQDPCDASRFTNLRLSVHWADPNVNPYDFSSFVCLETFGTKSRPKDRMGIAYFYNSLSEDFQNLLNFLEPHRSMVQGGEVYYNAQITPWSYLTFNLQAVNPVNASRETAIVPGLRYRVNF